MRSIEIGYRPKATLAEGFLEVWLARSEIETLPLIDFWSRGRLCGTSSVSPEEYEAAFKDIDRSWFPVRVNTRKIVRMGNGSQGREVLAMLRGENLPLVILDSADLDGPPNGARPSSEPVMRIEAPLWRVEAVYWHESELTATGWLDWSLCPGSPKLLFNGRTAQVFGPSPNERGAALLASGPGSTEEFLTGFIARASFDEMPTELEVVWESQEVDGIQARVHRQFLLVPDDLAIPPDDLRSRASGIGSPAHLYLNDGLADFEDLASALEEIDRPLSGLQTPIIEFGCGSGRVTQFLSSRADSQRDLFGIDVDLESIDWCRQFLPGVFIDGALNPSRLKDLPNHVDLVVAMSVFSHLPKDDFKGWLEQLGGWLTPHGLLMISLHGPTSFSAAVGANDKARDSWDSLGYFAEPVPLEVTPPALVGSSAYATAFYSLETFTSLVPKSLNVVKRWPGRLSGFQDLVALSKVK